MTMCRNGKGTASLKFPFRSAMVGPMMRRNIRQIKRCTGGSAPCQVSLGHCTQNNLNCLLRENASHYEHLGHARPALPGKGSEGAEGNCVSSFPSSFLIDSIGEKGAKLGTNGISTHHNDFSRSFGIPPLLQPFLDQLHCPYRDLVCF